MNTLTRIFLFCLTLMFTIYAQAQSEPKEQLYLSLNIDEGARLELSNGKAYEIAPEDRLYSAYWITPFPIMLSKSDNPDYPVKITNLNSGTSVNAREISLRETLREEERIHKEAPQMPTTPQKPTQPKTPKPSHPKSTNP